MKHFNTCKDELDFDRRGMIWEYSRKSKKTKKES